MPTDPKILLELPPMATSPLEIARLWHVSTSHITDADSRILHDECPYIGVLAYKEGWWINVPDGPDLTDELLNALLTYGLSPCVGHILTVARSHLCDWVRLDADAPVYDFLPQYEW